MLAYILNKESSSPVENSTLFYICTFIIILFHHPYCTKTPFVYYNLVWFFSRWLKDVAFIFLLIYYLDLHTHPFSIPKWQHVIDSIINLVETFSESL